MYMHVYRIEPCASYSWFKSSLLCFKSMDLCQFINWKFGPNVSCVEIPDQCMDIDTMDWIVSTSDFHFVK